MLEHAAAAAPPAASAAHPVNEISHEMEKSQFNVKISDEIFRERPENEIPPKFSQKLYVFM
jgi:hypothetical protein